MAVADMYMKWFCARIAHVLSERTHLRYGMLYVDHVALHTFCLILPPHDDAFDSDREGEATRLWLG